MARYNPEDDAWLYGVGDPYGREMYEAAGVPAPMVPGLQPWQTGEPVGELATDDWRGQAFEAGGWSAGLVEREPLQRCGYCRGDGCHGCNFTGWER